MYELFIPRIYAVSGDSGVEFVMGYGLAGRGNISIPGRSKGIYRLHIVHTGSAAHNGYRVLFPRGFGRKDVKLTSHLYVATK
jgi:hypothetical protein